MSNNRTVVLDNGLTRPAPLRDVAAGVARWTAILAGLVTSAVGWGLLTSQTGDALTGLLGLIPGLVTAVAVAVAALRTAVKGEDVVTPVSDPMTTDGTRLVPSGY